MNRKAEQKLKVDNMWCLWTLREQREAAIAAGHLRVIGEGVGC